MHKQLNIMRNFIILAFLAGMFTTAEAQVSARLFQFPDVSETMITFVYGDDVWIAPKTGGLAHRLSSPEGTEAFPRFSPDGKQFLVRHQQLETSRQIPETSYQ